MVTVFTAAPTRFGRFAVSAARALTWVRGPVKDSSWPLNRHWTILQVKTIYYNSGKISIEINLQVNFNRQKPHFSKFID